MSEQRDHIHAPYMPNSLCANKNYVREYHKTNAIMNHIANDIRCEELPETSCAKGHTSSINVRTVTKRSQH